MKKAFVIAKRKNKYGPIADAVQKASKKMGFDFCSLYDDLSGYKYIIFFDSKFKGTVKSDSDAKVGWWMNDLRKPEELNRKYLCDSITHIFLCNKEYEKLYEDAFNLPVYYMPQCGLEFEEYKKRDINWDILFIGGIKKDFRWIHENRREILEYFRKYSRYRIGHIIGERTTWDQRYLYHYTPINLAISKPVEGYNSNRLYNILASRGFVLCLYFPGIEKLFENGKHLVWFKTYQEAMELSEYYIEHEQERKQIAENGYQLFLEKHRAEQRLQNMYDIMSGKTNKFYGYL